MLLSVIASTSSRATKRSPNNAVQVAAASLVRAAGRAATSTALRRLFTCTDVALVCRAVATVVPSAMIGATTPRRARYRAPNEQCELITTLCSGCKCGMAASNTARWPNPGTATTTAMAPASASAQVRAIATENAPSIVPVACSGAPLASAAVRAPDGDHKTGVKARWANNAAFANAIDPAPRIAILPPVIRCYSASVRASPGARSHANAVPVGRPEGSSPSPPSSPAAWRQAADVSLTVRPGVAS